MMADERDPQPDASSALLGVPTGEETLNRGDLDDLEVSPKQQKRPKGMTRAQYMRSGPGTDTRTLIAMAGVSRRRRIAMVIATCLVVSGAGALIWHLVLRG